MFPNPKVHVLLMLYSHLTALSYALQNHTVQL